VPTSNAPTLLWTNATKTQQLQPFRPQHAGEKAHARDVAPRSVEAGHKTVLDRIAPGREDDRHRRGCGPGCERRKGVASDYGHRPANQFGHQHRQPIIPTLCKAIFDHHTLTLYEACFLEALAERGYEGRRVGGRRAAEKSDYRHRRLLRTRRERPRRRRSSHPCNEIASSHCGP
jgi:hypothetical protein